MQACKDFELLLIHAIIDLVYMLRFQIVCCLQNGLNFVAPPPRFGVKSF